MVVSAINTNYEAAIAAQNVGFIVRQYTVLRDDETLGNAALLSDLRLDGTIAKYARTLFWANAQGLMEGVREGPLAMPIRVQYYEPPYRLAVQVSAEDSTERYGPFDELQDEEHTAALSTVNRVLDLMTPLLQQVVLPPGEWPAAPNPAPVDE